MFVINVYFKNGDKLSELQIFNKNALLGDNSYQTEDEIHNAFKNEDSLYFQQNSNYGFITCSDIERYEIIKV